MPAHDLGFRNTVLLDRGYDPPVDAEMEQVVLDALFAVAPGRRSRCAACGPAA
jgi:hypothetical protein